MSESSEVPVPYFVTEDEFRVLLSEVDRGALYATVAEEEGRSHFEKISPERISAISLRCLPAVESIKSFLFPAKERVAVYPEGPAEPDTGLSADAPQIVLGARACDMVAVEVLDRILCEGEFGDPFYKERRENTLLIGVDCGAPAETCFCNLVGGRPYPESGFDLSLTPLADGYVVEIGSEAGRELVLERAHSFKEATPEQLEERDRFRAACVEKLEEQNAGFRPARPITEALAERDMTEAWVRLAAACVECGGCSYVCPTCHCFLLYDQIAAEAEGACERIKAWDSCLSGGFARMAGVAGMKATPRPELRLRFENRVRHKFEWLQETIGRIGCIGCGRCAEVCLGGCDIREVIKEIGG